MNGRWISIAALLGLTAVGAGAFGAHALRDRLTPEHLASFEVAVRYQMFHALALLGAAWVSSRRPSRLVRAASVAILIGVVLFSGSLYGLTLADWKWLWPLTPLGGMILMIGWLLLAIGAWPKDRGSREAAP